MSERAFERGREGRPAVANRETPTGRAVQIGAALLALSALWSEPAPAVEWRIGDVDFQLDSTLTAAGIWRLRKPDRAFIGVANGGRAPTLNLDDGNLNYRRRGLVAAPFRGVTTFEASSGGFGVHATASYWGDPRNSSPDATDRTPLSKGAFNLVGRGGRLLDAYAFGNVDVAGVPITVRVGTIPLNWGEAGFIPNGISVVSPYDVTKIRAPGASLQEALLPVPMVDVTFRLSATLSLEVFTQFAPARNVYDPVGSFYSTSDLIGEGGDRLLLGYLPPVSDVNLLPGTYVTRGRTRESDRLGQFGLALRYAPEWARNTEIGLYGLNVASRAPLLTFRTGTVAPFALAVPGLANVVFAQTSSFNNDYPRDVRLVGSSVSTKLFEFITFRAEGSWRFGQPLQLDFSELGFAALSPVAPVFGLGQLGQAGFGQTLQGWRRHDVGTLIASISTVLPGILRADGTTLIYEAGLTAVPDLPGKDRLRYAGPGALTSGSDLFTALGLQPYTTTRGAFATRVSGGHRFVTQLDYYNVFGSTTVSPRLAYAQDLAGVTPLPLGTYSRQRQAISAGLTATWLSNYSAGIEYTRYFGGGLANPLRDRDTVASYIRVSF